METPEKKFVGRECRFAWHVPSRHSDTPDIHIIKEQHHFDDGSMMPKLRIVENYKRPYWYTPKSKRNYEQKREWDSLENLLEKKVTQSKLRDDIARTLEMPWSPDPLKKLLNSPYIYGADISSSSLIKKEYKLKYPNLVSAYTRCILDVESDVTRDKTDPEYEDIIMTTVIFKGEAYISVVKSFVDRIADIETKLQAKCRQYIGEYLDKHQMKVTLHIAEDVVDMLRAVFRKVHEWKPDWLAIWNIKFDIPKMIDMLDKYGVDPREIFCDPSIPRQYQVFKWIPGPDKKTTASGKVQPINPAAQWHTLRCTAGYYAIDAMCVYKHLRLGEQEEPSYSLDWILQKHLGIRKLHFKEAEHLEDSRLMWHKFMQTNFKIEYMVYNIFDCLSMLELDDKTKDLSYSLAGFSDTTDFWNFKSQPRRIMDNLHYYALEQGCVMGTVGYQDKVEAVSDKADDDEDLDAEDDEDNTAAEMDEAEVDDDGEVVIKTRSTLSLKRWIVTLPAHMSVLGLPLILEDPSLLTNYRTHVYDSDEVSAYPSATVAANVSKATTKREIIDVVGIKEMTFRYQNMNLLLGGVNALEYAQTMFNMPKPDQLLEQFMRDGI